MNPGTQIVAGLLVGFVLGSIPSGYLLVRLKTGADVRDSGSGNIGATNVGRVLGAKGGVLTLVLDGAKGAVAVVLGGQLGVAAGAAAALGAVLGHCYTPWLGGRGGKGVATLLGSFAVLAPLATAGAAVVLVAVAALSRMMSLASLLASAALPLIAWLRAEPRATVVAAIAALVVIVWRHRANIGRIAAGQERKLGSSSP
jgi:glycerol-3-phosphate acyltransferase PlsY